MKGTLFALARNRNDIDANEKLKSMLYQVEATGAAFIDGKNILADSIFARHIQAGSITTEHMTAGSIKGDRIEVGTLNGDRITANTITSNMIHTAGLDAGVIKTGTISAGNGVSVINMANGEFSLAGGKMGYVAATDRLYLGMGTLYMGEVPIEEHNRMVGNRDSALTKKTTLTNEKAQWDASYAGVYGNTNLTGTPKTNLASKYTAYGTAYTNVTNDALNAVINAPTSTSISAFATLQGTVDTKMTDYRTALSELTTALTAAEKAIADKLAANTLSSANQNTTNIVAETVPYSIVFSNENQSIPTDAVGVLKGSFIFGSDILVFRGSTRTSGTIGTVVLKDKDGIAVVATGGTISINVTQPTASITGKVEVLFSAGANLSAEMGYLDVPITVNGVVYNKRMTWNKSRDGEASRSYNLVLNTLSLQGIPGGGYSPSIIEGNVSARLGTEPIMGESGYFLIYEQSRESITMDEYNILLENGQVAVDKEYIISDVMYPLVQRYTSTIPETEFSYTPSENTSMVLIAIYADSGFTNLLDYQSVPIIYEGQNAYGMQLTATNGLVFKFDQFNANKGMADTVLTPVLTNITNATYAWKLNGSATVSATTPTVTVGYSALNNVDSIKYLCEVSGMANGVSVTVSDTVTVSKVKDGSDTYNIILTNESVNIPTAENGTSPVLTGANTNVKLYYGTVAKTPTLTLSSQTGGTATIDATDTTKVSIATVTADAGYIDILVKDGTTTVGTKRFSFARSKQGVSGRSITAVDVEYYLSTSSTAQADGNWSTTAPAWTSGKYMWSRTKTTYSTGSPTYSNPACITGTAGQTGGTGTGITSITEEFYLSSSKTTQIGSSWGTAMPTWVPNTYMWTRSKIIYSNPTSTVYTTPLVDSSWEAVNQIQVGGTNLIRTSYIENRGCSTFTYNAGTNTWQCVAPINSGSWGFGFVISSGGKIAVNRGRTFLVSLEVKPSVDCTWNNEINNTFVGNSGGNDNDDRALAKNSSRNLTAGIWNKVWFSYTATSTLDLIEANSNWGIVTGASTISFEMKNIKGELGTIPTEWTPASEDISAQIETKAKTFTSTPVVPYNSGDIWRNGTSVYVCSTSRSTGSFLLSEWTLTADKTTVQRINDDPDTQRIEGNKMHFTNEVLMDNAWIDNLVANSIVATKIQTTELDAGKITAGTLNAGRIAAGSLSGDKITANTIDATRLKIGSGAQGGYINNPRFSAWSGAYPDGTSLWSAGGISKVTVDTVSMAQFAPTAGAQQGMELSSSYFANGIDLDGMQYFALECRFRLTSGTNPAGASFLVDIYRQDSSYERMQLDMKEVGVSVTTNTWYVVRKVFKLADANVAKTFKNVGGYLLANWSGAGDAAKTIQFASVNMFQASAQEFLAQSWTNGGTTSINGGFIATGTLSADKITTGALNASLITTGDLDAARITAGTINAGNGKSTINMSTGAFSFGSGKIAFDGTTLSLNVDSLKITNSSVATESYASTAAGTAKTEAIAAAANDATSKVDSIEVGGRNLIIEKTLIKGFYLTATSATEVNASWAYTDYIPVLPGEKFIVNGYSNLGSAPSTVFSDANKVHISGVAGSARVKVVAPANSAYMRFSLETKDIGKVKLERGNRATDWTPAPEDVTYDIEQKADTVAVSDAINNISSSVSGAQATASAKLDKSAYDNFIKEYGEYKDALAADQSVAAGNLQAAQTAVASIQKEMGDMKESWMFNNGTKIEATPNGMLISDGNPTGMNMLLSQNRISFFDGGVEVAYIADKTMKINNGIFVKSAQIGSHLISTSPTNSDITIVSFVGEG